MLRERQNRRFRVAFTICMVLGLIEAALIMGFGGYFKGSVLQIVFAIVMCIGLAALVGMVQWFFPYAIVVLGMAKVREQRREAMEALGDENIVQSDPDGHRKLHEYLSAINSTEARIGLLQRSDPYPGPDSGELSDKPLTRVRLSKPSRRAIVGYTLGGLVLGAYYFGGLAGGNEIGEKPLQLLAGAAVGGIAGLLNGALYSLLFRKLIVVEEKPDDAGRSGSEAA